MERPYSKKGISSVQRDEKRLTTAPIRQRPKYGDFYKTNNIELPVIRGKNYGNRETGVMSRDFKRPQVIKKEQGLREHDEQFHKRPQTSKGSRGINKGQSEYYQEGEDDLMITSMQQKLQILKKMSKDNPNIIKIN